MDPKTSRSLDFPIFPLAWEYSWAGSHWGVVDHPEWDEILLSLNYKGAVKIMVPNLATPTRSAQVWI